MRHVRRRIHTWRTSPVASDMRHMRRRMHASCEEEDTYLADIASGKLNFVAKDLVCLCLCLCLCVCVWSVFAV
jgi:hypothetical protein